MNDAGVAEITDDTQMTIFTAEGLLRAFTRSNWEGSCHIPSVVYHAYLRWLYTQGIVCKGKEEVIEKLDGWVPRIKSLYVQRGPGNTCLSALASGKMGSIEEPINKQQRLRWRDARCSCRVDIQ